MFLIILLLCIIAIAVIFIVYLKLTCGICKSSRHLVGKVVIITGANRGIGFETAKNLADRGARVILACRNEILGKLARDNIISFTENKEVIYHHLDLSSLSSVKTFANIIFKTEKRLDILINNAGVVDEDNVKTEDGLSLIMQVNYFGHFLLTNLLLPLLKSSAPSRLIIVSSMAYKWGDIDCQNLNVENTAKSALSVYSDSKLCNVLMTVELAKRLDGTGVTANCLHPGAVGTDIVRNKWVKLLNPILIDFCKTEWEGAQTSIFLAVSPDVDGISGSYFSDCIKRNISKKARDSELAQELWDVSERLVQLK